MAQILGREATERWVVPDYTQIWKQERSGDSVSDKRHQLKQFDCLGRTPRTLQGGKQWLNIHTKTL